MPITAKFSKKFYDTLGHDIADEMVDWFNRADETYRTDMYRINDLNFARFEAKVDQRFAEYDARLETRIAEVGTRIGGVETKMEAMRADLMKWMFGAWATSTATTIGTAIAIVKLLG